MADDKDYTAVPPPESLSAPKQPLDFNDALSKARAIAEKLKQQRPAAAPPSAPSAGSKRGYYDDGYEDQSYQYGEREDREPKRGMYESQYESRRYGLGSEERRGPSSTSYMNAGPVIQDELMVPSHMVGMVIGRGGDSLRRIERLSGAKVQFAEDMGEPDRRVNITGEPDQVKIAKDMIQQVVDDTHAQESGGPGSSGASASGGGGNMGAGYGGRSTNSMSVPSAKVGLIIGRGGETIRDLEERSGAKITVTQEGDRSGERTISLIGHDSAIERARNLILDIVNDEGHGTAVTSSRDWSAYRQQHEPAEGYGRHSNRYGGGGRDRDDGAYGPPPTDRYRGPSGGGGGGGRYGGDEREFIQVPKSAVGFIIGRGGETVRSLQEQSGARIKVDPNGDPSAPERTINIFGNPDAVAQAKQLIMDKVAEGNANRGGHGRYERGGEREHRGYSNNRYNQQQQDYSASTSNDYYSQYQGYYGQYGYDQYSGSQDAQGYQYGSYPYNYEGYGQYAADGKDGNAAEGESNEAGHDNIGKGGDTKDENNTSTSQAAADYYAQYYGSGGGEAGGEGGADQQQWNQDAYYQWYQQYYGDGQQYQDQQQVEGQHHQSGEGAPEQ
ncbi:hypothetical protein K492DRAFT_176883 [Lichtheimia hyalospora FSU 10163]|nr:hypothetical protein K492DRAFT_176883 [Lichtheimia hyalospora FSU 10163]